MGSLLRWLPLGLLALLTACGPAYRVRAEPTPVPVGGAGVKPRYLPGTWALTRNDNLQVKPSRLSAVGGLEWAAQSLHAGESPDRL